MANTFVPGAPNALPRSRLGEKTPGRDVSDVATFQTKKRVLPRTYSHRRTTVLRSDLRLKSGSSSRVTGTNSNELGRASFPMLEYFPTATNGCRKASSVISRLNA